MISGPACPTTPINPNVVVIERARDAYSPNDPMFAALDHAAAELAVLSVRDMRRQESMRMSVPDLVVESVFQSIDADIEPALAKVITRRHVRSLLETAAVAAARESQAYPASANTDTSAPPGLEDTQTVDTNGISQREWIYPGAISLVFIALCAVIV